eukprot:scaffold230929_cov25-Attheya_sp.AAC.2
MLQIWDELSMHTQDKRGKSQALIGSPGVGIGQESHVLAESNRGYKKYYSVLCGLKGARQCRTMRQDPVPQQDS